MGTSATFASGQYVIRMILGNDYIGALNLTGAAGGGPPNPISGFNDSNVVAQVWYFEQQSNAGSYILTNWDCLTNVSNGNVAAIPGSQSGEQWNITQYTMANGQYAYTIQTSDYSAGWLLDESQSQEGIYPVTCNTPLNLEMGVPDPDQGFLITPYTG